MKDRTILAVALGLLLAPGGCRDDTDGTQLDAGPDGADARCDSGPVGVEECPGGLKLPSGGSCTLVGPPATCPTGWSAGSDGLCAPILPTAACSGATMEVIGQASCQPVGDCGTGTWGEIKGGATTIYVDQGYTGGGSDGSSAKPYTTVGAAVAAAAAGGHLAIAAGEYQESVKVAKQLTIEGRCPEKVTVNDQGTAGVAIQVSAKGVTVRGLTLTGKGRAIQVVGGTAQVEQVVADGCGGPGVEAVGGGEITIQDSVIRASTLFGIAAFSSTVTLERSVVRDTQQKAGEIVCAGIYGLRMDNTPTVLTVKDSLLANNVGIGLNIWGCDATLERTVVRETQPVLGGVGGWGIYADWEVVPSTLMVRDSQLANNGSVGLYLSGSNGVVERTTIRDTQNADGMGSGIWVDRWTGPGSLSLRDSAVVDNKSEAINVAGSSATIERTLVKSSAATGIVAMPQADPTSGASSLTVRDSILASNVRHGIAVHNSTATVERCLIHHTSSKPASGDYGDGIVVSSSFAEYKGELSLTDCLVSNSARAGLLFIDAGGTVSRSVFREGTFSIVLDQGAYPKLNKDNIFEANEENAVVYGKGLKAAPLPKIPDPPLPP